MPLAKNKQTLFTMTLPDGFVRLINGMCSLEQRDASAMTRGAILSLAQVHIKNCLSHRHISQKLFEEMFTGMKTKTDVYFRHAKALEYVVENCPDYLMVLIGLRHGPYGPDSKEVMERNRVGGPGGGVLAQRASRCGC